ncbi:uncharacterized protein LACBIDRAFT_334373 [Laccaria bicolor S238N-H82]|uniref:Predicted protein n=1 Tax=Laccaria bicolor (strain S238N-H82 / ATCC MYA-4686) TaxID=486041 RepID=B0DZ03_LACBS|nr:uncharacterized protein LACBIDRAFT_334373 [Laccaria bicolor S238N-H82]EDR00147.1 predicted protein [Laccaria bicolor S238N-H82]|eukprot:XP_001889204.1 predicted protein [Laccaria bicolor S238N-H82]
MSQVTNKPPLQLALRGDSLLTSPRFNKGAGFPANERTAFGLIGRLPYRTNTLDEQCERAYEQLTSLELAALFLLVSCVVIWWDGYVHATTLARAQAVVVANNTLQQPAMRGMPTLQIQNPASTRPSLDITLADAGSVRSLNSEVFTTSSESDNSTPRQENTTNFQGWSLNNSVRR